MPINPNTTTPRTTGTTPVVPRAPQPAQPAAPQAATNAPRNAGWSGSHPSLPTRLSNARFTDDARFAQVAAGRVTLSTGASGDTVKALQQTLTDMGFADPEWKQDGKFGPQTRTGVRNFQINAAKMFPDVKITGELDAATMRAMNELAPPPGQQGQTKNVPKGIFTDANGKQTKLRALALKDEHRTFIFDDKGNVAKIVINAVGMPREGSTGSRTNEGLMKVDTKWDQAAIRQNMAPPKFNPVFYGEHMLPLSYADGRSSPHEFHGTNEPQRLGLDASHGCVRHSREGAKALFDALNPGDRVAILRDNDPRIQWR